MIDATELSQRLIQCQSITPVEGGALELLEKELSSLGFTCTRLDYDEVSNLHARIGTCGPHLAFAGHTDVVPLGDASRWTHSPFSGEIIDGKLWGRGAADMKCAIACFIAAVQKFLNDNTSKDFSLSFIITGDEEGPAVNGTKRMLDWLQENNHIPDLCLIGEPSSEKFPGDAIKIGRRGSITGKLTCFGTQGHIAYPHLFDNPIPRLLNTIEALRSIKLDQGNIAFEPSRLEITSIDVGNDATNIIPGKASAMFGIRINNELDGNNTKELLENTIKAHAGQCEFKLDLHGNAFLTQNDDMISMVCNAVQKITGKQVDKNTRGGTSDGRFLTSYCPVIELGMTEATMHQIDEHVELEDIKNLTNIYKSVIYDFYKR